MRNKYSLPGFLKVTAIPKLAWTSPRALTLRPPMTSVIMLVKGQILFGLGEAILIVAGLESAHGLFLRKGWPFIQT